MILPGNKAIILLNYTLVLFFSSEIIAQNIEKIGKENPLEFSGSFGINQILNLSNQKYNKREPYQYFVYGNITLNLYEWMVPFSFSYSNQNKNFQQPFNQYGLSPKYKWLTLHAGYRSMVFSPYTLNGHIFKGVGIELNPAKKWGLSAMYGLLRKPVLPDSTTGIPGEPVFKRIGYGLKASYIGEKSNFDLILFGAKDDVNSIPNSAEEINLLPERNLAGSIIGGTSISDKLKISVEMASSTISTNLPTSAKTSSSLFYFAKGLFTPEARDDFRCAVKTQLSYSGRLSSIGLSYEHIDPDYRTFGAYYFNNDLENITVNYSRQMINNKVSLSFRGGLQRNNLNNSELNETIRIIGSMNLTAALSEKLNTSGSYSNISSYSNLRPNIQEVIGSKNAIENMDTLNYVQISQNANWRLSWTLLKSKIKYQQLNFNLSIHEVSSDNPESQTKLKTTYTKIVLTYNHRINPKNQSFSAAINVDRSASAAQSTYSVGSTGRWQSAIKDQKVKLAVSIALNKLFGQPDLNSTLLTSRIALLYRLNENHNFDLSMGWNNRKNRSLYAINEMTATLNYNYRF